MMCKVHPKSYYVRRMSKFNRLQGFIKTNFQSCVIKRVYVSEVAFFQVNPVSAQCTVYSVRTLLLIPAITSPFLIKVQLSQ